MTTSTCTKEKLIVETEKGKYTLPAKDSIGGTCEAQERCTKLGGILAPFTEKSEFDSVMTAVKSCKYQSKLYLKLVGLHIANDDSSRVFTNGVKFDYGIHGDLYQENPVNMPRNCPNAVFDPRRQNKLQIGTNWNCRPSRSLYICFEPKKTTKADAITSDAANVNSTFLIAGGSIFLVAVVCLFGFMAKQIRNLKIKLQQTSNDV